jgi:hypothetical protein
VIALFFQAISTYGLAVLTISGDRGYDLFPITMGAEVEWTVVLEQRGATELDQAARLLLLSLTVGTA